MKKRILLWCSVLTLLICLLTSCGKSLEEQIAEQLELGQKYLTELNYEEAIVAFTKAIELDEKNVDAYIGRGQVYEAMGQAAGEESADGKAYYEQAAGEYEQALLLSSGNSLLYDRLLTIYQITGNLEGIQDLTEKDLSGITDEAVLAELEQVKTALEAIQKIADACEAGETDQAFEFMSSEEFAALRELSEELGSPVFQVENGKGLGLYLLDSFYECMIYYGEYRDGQRQGHGLWFGCNGELSYLAEGEWSNDVPNGTQEERVWASDGESWGTIGAVQNGLWHGEALRIIDDGNERGEFPVSFENGKYTVLSQYEGNGRTIYTVSEIVGSDGFPWDLDILDPDELVGVMGFVP